MTRHLAIAVAALTLALAGCGGGSDSEPRSAPTESAATAPLELALPAQPPAKCMVPNAEVLATQDTAFEGTVTAVDDTTATLSVDHWYAGSEQSDSVVVALPDAGLQDLLLAVDFTEGVSYLVSAQDARVSLCGFSAKTSPELEALYAEAFGG